MKRIIVICIALYACISISAQEFTTKMPAKAYDFINSIGVNTHFGYYDTNYKLYEERLRPRLIELGVKHIRDGTYDLKVVEKYKDIGNQGIRLLLITDAKTAVEKAKAIGPMLWGIEGVNEPDIRKKPGEWEEYARNEQQTLFSNLRADKETEHIAIVGISLANIKDNPARLGDLSKWMNYGGMHPYPAGQHPAMHWGWGLSMEQAISTARLVSKDHPLIATEGGYHNKIDNPGHPGVSEEAAAIYHVHLPFVYFNQGLIRTYKYEFLDLKPDAEMTDMECHFGLIRSDGSAKPSFDALKNLLSLLSDEERTFTVQPLLYSISAPEGETIHQTLLQKSDGSWWLALLRTISVFDLKTKKDIEVAPVNIQLHLKEKAKTVSLYMPNRSAKAFSTKKRVKKVEIPLGAELILIEIK
ncbi:MAG: hypothetical protein LBV43_05555 [Prevotella sp.]|jgi:hypothetical protein|nr:hypothetical protein [Prevotella sp.]